VYIICMPPLTMVDLSDTDNIMPCEYTALINENKKGKIF